MVKVAIIGGSGLDDPKILTDPVVREVSTPYGTPSSPLICGTIEGVEVVILARHGHGHRIPPTQVPFRANLYALKEAGCTHILATTAVGSLRDEIAPGHFVVLDQFIDFTRHRTISYYDAFPGDPIHVSLADPFDADLRAVLTRASRDAGVPTHDSGTVVTIEGPRFSTRAESHMFRGWGADVINMSIAPEATLARELEIPYAAVAMSTDYDCWKTDEEPVTWEAVLATFRENAANMRRVLLAAIPQVGVAGAATPVKAGPDARTGIKAAIRTIPHFPIEGVMFRDVTTLFADSEGLRLTAAELVQRYRNAGLTAVAGIESRGFILGSILAHELGVGMILLRKPGKLPAETERVEYTTEYSTDAIEVHRDAIGSGDRILVLDDLVATGGTALAACQLVEKLGGTVHECAFVVDLPELGGTTRVREAGYDTFHLIEFEGE